MTNTHFRREISPVPFSEVGILPLELARSFIYFLLFLQQDLARFYSLLYVFLLILMNPAISWICTSDIARSRPLNQHR